jgi:hypothetical protein
VRVARKAAARVDRVVGRRAAKAVKAVPAASKVARAEAKRVGKADRVVVEAVKVPVVGRRVTKAGKGADRAARVVAKAVPGAARKVAKVEAASRAASGTRSRTALKVRHTARGQSWRLAPFAITSDRENARHPAT